MPSHTNILEYLGSISSEAIENMTSPMQRRDTHFTILGGLEICSQHNCNPTSVTVPDPDIAGPGVILLYDSGRTDKTLKLQILLAFTISAGLTVLVEVAIAFLIVYRNERALKTLRTVLINPSDQQLITSLSVVIALIYRLRQGGDSTFNNYVSVFSYNLVMNMLPMSLISGSPGCND